MIYIEKLKKILEDNYPIKVDVQYEELRKELGGFMRKINKQEYLIKINTADFSSEAFTNLQKIYPSIPLNIIDKHVIIHEFCHIFDLVNEVSIHHCGSIHENSVEYFAEFLSWLIIYNDTELAKQLASNYASFRLPQWCETARKSIDCAVEVLYFTHLEEFKEISELFLSESIQQ